jgi:hypothetical protein
LNFAAPDAGSAHPHPFASASDERVYGLKIQIPSAFRYVVGMTDAIPELGTATTDFTNFCHKTHLYSALLSM